MQNLSPSKYLADLDFTGPYDLAVGFELLRDWPRPQPISAKKMDDSIETVRFFHPLIFNAPDTELTATYVRDFVTELGGAWPSDHPRFPNKPKAPRSWLILFRSAFERGQLSPIAMGAAFTFLMRREGIWTAEFPRHTAEAKRVMLSDLHKSSPLGLMDDEQRAALSDLPETVTIYRGGRGELGGFPHDNAQSVFWALDEWLAAKYMRARGAERTVKSLTTALNSTLSEGHRSLEALTLGPQATRLPPRRVQEAPRDMLAELGAPFLLRTAVPKELILAYNDSMRLPIAGKLIPHIEVLVDFDKITPEMIEDVTPEEYRWAA